MDTQEVGMKGEPYSAGGSARFSVLTWRGGTGQVGREAQGGGAVCIHATDSLHCTAESNTALSSNYTPMLLLFKKDVSSPGC